MIKKIKGIKIWSNKDLANAYLKGQRRTAQKKDEKIRELTNKLANCITLKSAEEIVKKKDVEIANLKADLKAEEFGNAIKLRKQKANFLRFLKLLKRSSPSTSRDFLIEEKIKEYDRIS